MPMSDPPFRGWGFAWTRRPWIETDAAQSLWRRRTADERDPRPTDPLGRRRRAPEAAPVGSRRAAELPPARCGERRRRAVALGRAKSRLASRLRRPRGLADSDPGTDRDQCRLICARRHRAVDAADRFALFGHRLPVNLRGLVFADVSTRRKRRDGVQMLVVEGIVKNSSPLRPTSGLRFGVRNEGGQEIYSWTALPDRKVLPPARPSIPFLVGHPAAGGRDVVGALLHPSRPGRRNDRGIHGPHPDCRGRGGIRSLVARARRRTATR